MAFVSFKKEINRVYTKIDKIAKVGRDNYQEYFDYVDNLIMNGQYGVLTQVLLIKYDFDYSKFTSVTSVKSRSWSQICFRTTTVFQDTKYNLLKNNNLYQLGIDIYKENQLTSIKLVDPESKGKQAEFNYKVAQDSNRGLIQITVKNQGYDYSTSSTISVIGGSPSAIAYPYISNGHVLKVDIGASGSNHDVNIKLGSISEIDKYVESIDPLAFTDNIFQQDTDNKVTFLIVDKVGVTMSMTFSNWDFNLTYDKNLLNLYSQAIDYLI